VLHSGCVFDSIALVKKPVVDASGQLGLCLRRPVRPFQTETSLVKLMQNCRISLLCLQTPTLPFTCLDPSDFVVPRDGRPRLSLSKGVSWIVTSKHVIQFCRLHYPTDFAAASFAPAPCHGVSGSFKAALPSERAGIGRRVDIPEPFRCRLCHAMAPIPVRLPALAAFLFVLPRQASTQLRILMSLGRVRYQRQGRGSSHS